MPTEKATSVMGNRSDEVDVSGTVTGPFGTVTWSTSGTDRITFSTSVMDPLSINSVDVYGSVAFVRVSGGWKQEYNHDWLRRVEAFSSNGRQSPVSTAARRKVEKWLESQVLSVCIIASTAIANAVDAA